MVSKKLFAIGVLLVCVVGWAAGRARAQDFSVLRINEVISDNNTTGPADVAGGTPDMVEIYNPGPEPLTIGILGNPDASLALSDSEELPDPAAVWIFGKFTNLTVLPGESIIVFCDGSAQQAACEPHASFAINSDGTEPITLWGPRKPDGTRDVIDRLWLPPLRADISFGRFPDGAGPAPMPKAQSPAEALALLESGEFVFNPPGQTSFGSCSEIPGTPCFCPPDSGASCFNRRFCRGGSNGPGGNIEPRVFRAGQSTNRPEPGEPVLLTVEVRDDKRPEPGNIAKVEIVYRVNGGPEETIEMAYDAATGLQSGAAEGRPMDVWSLWNGSIPGQPAGSRVEFYFRVTDAEGLSSTRPRRLCDEGIGPCDRDFGGPGCTRDPGDPENFIPCDKPFTYAVGYTPRPELASIVINEVCAVQDSILRDPSSQDPLLCGGTPEERPGYCCVGDDVPPGCAFEDFIELHNTSPTDPVDLSGLWLSNRYFEPRVWRFPAGSVIPPGGYVLVWLDNDGSKCPDPSNPDPPGFWECPDPNDPPNLSFHTNFVLDGGGDQIFLFDTEENNFGIVHGVVFGDQLPNVTLSLCPDGDRNGTFVETPGGSPGAPNDPACPDVEDTFKRGDSNNDCVVDLSDGVTTLNFLFRGGTTPPCLDAADTNDDGTVDISDAVSTFGFLFLGRPPPPPPGPFERGRDPTEDSLPRCSYNPECL